jgi:hypothetical protein
MMTLIYAAQLLLHMLGSLGDVGAGLVLLFALYKYVRALALQLRPSLRPSLSPDRLSRFAGRQHVTPSPVRDEERADAASD